MKNKTKKENKCIVEDCSRKQFWAKYCKRHYDEEFEINKRSDFAKRGIIV